MFAYRGLGWTSLTCPTLHFDSASMLGRWSVPNLRADIEHGEADIGIRCGPGTWMALQSIKLMDEEIFPVCADVLLNGKRAPKTINDLGKFTLIHDTTMKETRAFPSWESWFQRFGLKGDVQDRGLQINSSAAVIQATLKGQGIALVRHAFVRDEIESGQLIRLLPKLTWPISWACYVVGTKESLVQPVAAAFVEWVVATAGNYVIS